VPRVQDTQRAEVSTGRGLSEESIVDAACKLIEESGSDKLTMRRLSDELGVALGATYYYVPTRDALLVLVTRKLQDGVRLESADPKRWKQTLRRLMIDYAQVFSSHRGLTAFTVHHLEATGPEDTRNQILAMLDDAGFEKQSAHDLLGALFFYVSGFTIGEMIDEPAYPAALMAEQFEAGLDLLLTGAAVQLKEATRTGRTREA
jgi:TetR/AcrR family tetracycline transcriptional repressor